MADLSAKQVMVLARIRDRIRTVMEKTSGKTAGHLDHDPVFREEVLTPVMEIISDLRHIPDQIRRRYHQVPWDSLELAAHRLAGGDRANASLLLWAVASSFVPMLRQPLDLMLAVHEAGVSA